MVGTKILEEEKSKYNGDLRVLKTWGLGVYIQAGGLTQSGGIVELIWRKTLKKIKKSKFRIKNCLILGLGGGTVAKLIKEYWPAAKITGIDIDPIMIELGKKYLSLDELRIKIEIDDAGKYLKRKSKIENYDLVIVDLYKGDKFPKKFETENDIRLVRAVLSSNGVVVFNRLYYGSKKEEANKFGKILEKIFGKVEWFFPTVNLMFLCRH